MSIEASFLVRKGKVFAVERNAEDIELIKRNIAKFNAWKVRVIQAGAPEGLEQLPDPDAVFLGGSGGRMSDILEVISARLRPEGRVVLNLVTLENLSEAAQKLKSLGFEVDVTQVGISRSVDIADMTRLEPLSPVFVVSGKRVDG